LSDDRKRRWHAGWALHGLASAALYFWAFLAYAAGFPEGPHLLLAFAALAAVRFVSTLVHESGHALAALACGWRVVVFVVRPFGLQIPNGDVAMIRRDYKDDVGGWVTAVPGSAELDTPRRWSLIVAAGPLASLMLAAAGAFAWNEWAPLSRHGRVGLDYLGLGVALQALHSCVFSLLPVRSPRTSDGQHLWALRNGGYGSNRAIIWVETLLNSNVRLSRLPGWLVDETRALSASSDTIARYYAMLEIGRLFDDAPVDAVRARALLETFRARYGGDSWVAACDAYLAAIWEGDAGRAREVLAAGPPSPRPAPLSFAAEAALAARTGEERLMRLRLEDMAKALTKNSPFEDRTFRDIRRQIEAVLAEARPGQASLPSSPGVAPGTSLAAP
jgi:hypothetical protein